MPLWYQKKMNIHMFSSSSQLFSHVTWSRKPVTSHWSSSLPLLKPELQLHMLCCCVSLFTRITDNHSFRRNRDDMLVGMTRPQLPVFAKLLLALAKLLPISYELGKKHFKGLLVVEVYLTGVLVSQAPI